MRGYISQAAVPHIFFRYPDRVKCLLSMDARNRRMVSILCDDDCHGDVPAMGEAQLQIAYTH